MDCTVGLQRKAKVMAAMWLQQNYSLQFDLSQATEEIDYRHFQHFHNNIKCPPLLIPLTLLHQLRSIRPQVLVEV